jgi:hypothetical protein
MIERWVSQGRLFFSKFGVVSDRNFLALEQRLPERLVVEDVGTADAVMSFRHSLGRVPVGLVVVNQVVPSGTDPVAWYRVEGDDAWTAEVVTVRWTVSNASVVVQIW